MPTNPMPMREIDFLPVSYRERYAARRSQVWRFVIVTTVAVVITAAGYWQQRTRQYLEAELEVANWMFEQSAVRSGKLSQLKARLRQVEETAELLTFLRCRWPPTQILSAVVEPLPDSVRLTQIDIGGTSAAPEVRRIRAKGPRARDREEETPLAESAAMETLQELQLLDDATRTEVNIVGVSYDNRALHHYLAALADHSLLERPELLDLERVEDQDEVSYHFTARIAVVPSLGQPKHAELEDRADASQRRGRQDI